MVEKNLKESAGEITVDANQFGFSVTSTSQVAGAEGGGCGSCSSC